MMMWRTARSIFRPSRAGEGSHDDGEENVHHNASDERRD